LNITPDEPECRVAGVLLLALAALIAYDARRLQSLPVGPGTVPVLIAAALAIASLALFALSFSQHASADRQADPAASSSYNALYVGAVVALYLLSMAFLGYLLSTLFLVVAMLLKLADYRPWQLAALGVSVSLATYVLLEKLGLHLPAGLLESGLG
jgi:hypothetical protein